MGNLSVTMKGKFKMKKQKITFTALATVALTCFGLLTPKAFGSVRRLTGVIPTPPQLKGAKRFRASPQTLQTQQLVGIRCLALVPAASILLLVLERLTSTLQTTIQLSV
jgi:hypothetical protein